MDGNAVPQDEIAALKSENETLKRQLLSVQKAFLLQQRELNVYQMQQLEALEKSSAQVM